MCGYTHNFKMAASKSKWPPKKKKTSYFKGVIASVLPGHTGGITAV